MNRLEKSGEALGFFGEAMRGPANMILRNELFTGDGEFRGT